MALFSTATDAACLTMLEGATHSHAWKGLRGDFRGFQQFVLEYHAGPRVQQWLAKHGRAFVSFTFEEGAYSQDASPRRAVGPLSKYAGGGGSSLAGAYSIPARSQSKR